MLPTTAAATIGEPDVAAGDVADELGGAEYSRYPFNLVVREHGPGCTSRVRPRGLASPADTGNIRKRTRTPTAQKKDGGVAEVVAAGESNVAHHTILFYNVADALVATTLASLASFQPRGGEVGYLVAISPARAKCNCLF